MVVLGVPCINRPDLLRRCIDSIDIDVDLVIVDNSPDGLGDWPGLTLRFPGNLGVAASWNLITRVHPQCDYWLIANADCAFAPGDLSRLVAEMEQGGPRWVGMNGDWRVFGISRETIEQVGYFDENFHPIYCEDADYEYRCTVAGVPWYFIDGGAMHDVSASIRSGYGSANDRTYPANRAYYREKWGGDLRGGETFNTPFDWGGSVREWTLDASRVRELAW